MSQDLRGVVGIIGLGYVGLPTAMEAAHAGWKVVGFDIDRARTDALNSGTSHVEDVSNDTLRSFVENHQFEATTNLRKLGDCDVVLICVPTPINRSKEPDLGAVVSATRAVAQTLRRGQLVVLESTTYPGTTVEVCRPILEESGLAAGLDFHLAFAPERLEPGNNRYHLSEVPKVVGGLTQACTRAAVEFYGTFLKQLVPVSSPTTAEMVKIYENVFRCVNIAFVNELAMLCHRMGLDIWEVIEAARTKPYGFMPFYPGPGLGGHCIPVDPHYLAWKARCYDFHVQFIELAAGINDSMPYFVVERVSSAMNDVRRCINGSSVLVLGAAYKKDVADLRESPALKVMELLHHKGAVLAYHDPHVPRLEIEVDGRLLQMESSPLTSETLRETDCVVVLTDHSAIDWQLVADHARVVVDTRNAMSAVGSPRGLAVKL
jgi:UDP-N-acetyl-D-glucosamine dehydrogenase